MKKILLSMLILASSLVYNQANAQVYTQGSAVFDVYYGFPNLYASVLRGLYKNSTYYDQFSVKTLGPIGFNAEYLLSDNVGIGAEFTYTSTNASVRYHDPNNGQYSDISVDVLRIRALPRINFHLGSNDKVDPYLTVGMGYKYHSVDYKYSDPNVNDRADFKTIVPISTRFGVGVRYFFTDHLGLNMEFGLGGALLRGGISAKF